MRRFLIPLLFVLASCAPVPRPVPVVAPPQPRLTATGTAQRVVLVSFDGLGADALARQSGLAAFDHLAAHGATARVIPVSPTVTSTTHVSILTGAGPQRTGIVSNRFHAPGTPVDETARGMETDIDVETLVEAARRQGKRVGAVSFPTVDARNARRSADFGLIWSEPMTPGRMIKLTRADFRREWVPPTWTDRPHPRHSFSPIMRARIEWSVPKKTRLDVDLVAYDTTDDRAENYDLYLIEDGEHEIAPDAHGWFAISTPTADGLYGSWSKLMQPTASLDLTLYWGPVSRTNAYPDSYRTMLEEEAGFWPGSPDERAGVDAQTFIEQLVRLSDFYTRVQTATIRRMPFDLLLAYQPTVDGAMHSYLGAPDENAVVRAAFVAADHAVAEIGALLDSSRDALIVTGDHGLVPTLRDVRPNRLLAEGGFAPRWRAYVSGSVAHLYRFSGPDDADAVVAMLNASGLFELVEKKNSASHRNSGDIVAIAQPDIDLSPSSDPPAVAKADSGGHHGGLNTHPELHPAFLASSAGVPPGPLGEISQTSIARFVSQLLGIQPPSSAE
jgi:predicted AlkP superfamily pyrophosphatase or phosphodiesterase